MTIYFHSLTHSPMFCLFTYSFTSIPDSIPPSFLSQCPLLVNALDNDCYERKEHHQSLLQSYNTQSDCSINSVPSVVSYFSLCEFKRPSMIYKTICFLPASKAQTACLDALTIRWQYLLNEYLL